MRYEGARRARESDSAVLVALLDATGDVGFELDDSGVCLRVLGRPERAFAPPETLIGRRLDEALTGTHARPLEEALAGVRRGEEPRVLEVAVPTSRGPEPRELRLAALPGGTVLAVMRHALGTTDAERALELSLEQLGESEARFQALADSAPVLLWMTGTDANCNFFNDSWLRFTGRTLEQERGVGWAEGVYVEDYQRCMHTYLEAFVERRAFSMEYRLLRADGVYRWIYDQGLPRFAPDGTFAGFIGSCIDITDRREAQEQLRALNDEFARRVAERTAELVDANRELEAFSYSVSHDLRAPLQVIDGYSEAVLSDYGAALGEDARTSLGRVRAAAQRMGHLIDDLLKLSRLSRAGLTKDWVDLSQLARRVVADLRACHPGRDVTCEVQDGILVQADGALLLIALENLIGNAWKFTSKTPNARIEVTATVGANEVVCRVSDNGAGFDMASADKLFTPFQRLHARDDFPGSGVGLASVRRIIERHGGRLWAEGAVGHGATFFFTLPLGGQGSGS